MAGRMLYRKKTESLTAADGTRIAYHTHLGFADSFTALHSRPAVILTNGIGTTDNFWRYLVRDLEVDHRVVHWDYRGHGGSELARSGDYGLLAQAGDLARLSEAVMARSGGEAPLHVAFSMGVPVLLEMYRRHPERVRAMALLAGAPDAPGEGTILARVPGLLALGRGGLRAFTPLVPHLGPWVQKPLRWRAAYPVGRALGILRRRAPREDIEAFLNTLADMDPLAYWETLKGLMHASASDVLARVTVPTLVLAARHDTLVPLSQMKRMARLLPHARFLEVADAGHAGLLEAGSEIAEAVRSFLAEQGPKRMAAPSQER